MPESEDRSPEAGDNKSAGAGLYHKSSRSSRTRLLDESPRKKLISVEIGGTPRRKRSQHDSPFQHIMKANLKRLIIVGGLMVLLLVAAFQLVSIVASRPDTKSSQQAKTPAPGPGRRELPPSGEEVPPVSSNVPNLAPTVSADQFKKAVFLQNKARAFENAGNLELAIQNYREALEVLPNMPAVWAMLGRVYLKQKDFLHAQFALEKAAESTPAADIFNDLGVAYLWQAGKLDKAMTMFQTATEVDPNYAPTYFNKALGLLARNKAQKAREALEQYLRMKAGDPRGLRELAVLKAKEGDRREALKDLERAIAQAPDWPLLYFDSAAINALLGQCDTAIRFLEKAEPLAGPAAVFKIWQEPAFRECRNAELGKDFEKDLADRARQIMKEKEKPVPTSSEPIISPSP